jgi:hypothetical protein
MTVLKKAVLIDYTKLKDMIDHGTIDNETVYFLSGKDLHDKIKDIDTKIESKADQTSIPNISNLATKQEVTDAVAGVQVPSIEGLAKTTDVDTKLADYAKKTELPDVTTLATKAELATVESHISTVDVDAKIEAYNSDVESTYAKKSELPHFTAGSGIAISEDGVISATAPEVDLSDYVKDESLSLDGLDLVAKYEAAKIKYDNPLATTETTETPENH